MDTGVGCRQRRGVFGEMAGGVRIGCLGKGKEGGCLVWGGGDRIRLERRGVLGWREVLERGGGLGLILGGRMDDGHNE
jgi:hypothetical protein